METQEIPAQSGNPQSASPMLSRVLVLTASSAVAPALLLLVHPLLTRLYLPIEYGVFGVFEASVAILITLSALSYNLPITVQESESEARALVVISAISSLLFSLALGVFLFIWGVPLLDMLNAPALYPFLVFVPLVVFVSSNMQSLSYWAIRQHKFADIAGARAVQGACQASTQVGFGLANPSVWGLIAGLFVGRLLGLLVLARRTGLRHLYNAMRENRPAGHARMAWKYRRFPLLANWSAAISSITLQFVVLLVNYAFGTETAGLFSLAFLVTVGPAYLVTSAVEQSFLAEVADLDRSGALAASTGRLMLIFLRISAAPCLLFIWFAPELFAWVFGEPWRQAGSFAQFLAPLAVAGFVGAHLQPVVIIRSLQAAELGFSAIRLVLCAAMLILGAAYGDAEVAIAGYSLAGVVVLLGYDLWLMRVAGGSVATGTLLLAREVGLAVLCITPLLADRWLLEGQHPASSGILSAVLVIALLAHAKTAFSVDSSAATGADGYAP